MCIVGTDEEALLPVCLICFACSVYTALFNLPFHSHFSEGPNMERVTSQTDHRLFIKAAITPVTWHAFSDPFLYKNIHGPCVLV